MASSGYEDNLSFIPTLALAIAGINIVWGIFLYPWGLLGFAFAAVDIYLFFLSLKIREQYEARMYEDALRNLNIFVPLGFVCGLLVLGAAARPVQKRIDDIITKRILIKSSPGKVFAPPQFPNEKN